MTPIKMKIGYLMVGPTINGCNVNTYVHAMVAECFIGPRPDGAEINHIDGDKANPHSSNLEYVSHHENMAHARGAGLLQAGEAHWNAKLDDVEVADVRARRSGGESVTGIARSLGMAPSTISQITTGQRRA